MLEERERDRKKENKLQTCKQMDMCGVIQRGKKTSSKHACKWARVVLDYARGAREREEHKSVGVGTCMERENKKNIGAHACMHMGSNQKNYSGTEPSKRYWAE